MLNKIGLSDLLTSHFGFKIDLNYLRINVSTEDLYIEDKFKKLIKHVASKIDTIKKDPECNQRQVERRKKRLRLIDTLEM
jgi:hypothetical protein